MTSQVIIKIEKLLFYFFILCLPFQTRLVLVRWAPLPEIVFNEWTSGFLYLSDLFVAGLLVLWLLRRLLSTSQVDKEAVLQKRDFVLLGLLIVSALSITQSHFLKISFYQLAKLLEFVALYFYVRANRNKVFNVFGICWAVFVSGIFQAGIAIVQYFQQSSLGLRWLGESPLHLPGEGIASFYSGAKLILRPYGTLPHPNILAAFLFVALVVFVLLYLGGRFKNRFWLLSFAAIVYSFFLTYSRTVVAIPIILTGLFLLVAWFNKNWRRQLLQYKRPLAEIAVVSVFVVALFLSLNYHEAVSRVFFSVNDEAISLRLFYNRVAGQNFLARTWLGSGIGTFVPNMMVTLKHVPNNIFQPVHNVYLLILAETGLLGLAFWGLFIKSTIRSYMAKHDFSDIKNAMLPLLLYSFLLIGFLDHFLWTIQQGRLLLWVILALF